MGVLANILPQAQPAVVGDGCEGGATEGRDWEFVFTDFVNPDGSDCDLTTVTGSCIVKDAVDGTQLAELTFLGDVNSFALTCDASNTLNLAGGPTVRKAVWSLLIADGDVSVQVWGPSNSPFSVYPE